MGISPVINKISLRHKNKMLRQLSNLCICLLCCFSTQYVVAKTTTTPYVNSGDNVSGNSNNGRFGSFGSLTINNRNQVAFKARLFDTTGGEDDDSGIYDFLVTSINFPTVTTINEIVRENRSESISGTIYQIDDLMLFNNSSFISKNAAANVVSTGDSGHLALYLTVKDGNDTGDSILVVQSQGGLNLVAKAGDEVRSGNGTYKEFGGLNLYGVSSNNRVTFVSALNDTENGEDDNAAFFQKVPGSSTVELVRKGDSNQLVFIAALRVNDSGSLIFSGYDSLVASTSKQTIFYSAGGSGNVAIIAEDDLVPTDDEDNRYFSRLSETRINNDGAIGFMGRFIDEGGMSVPNNTGLYITANGGTNVGVTEIVREGQLTPDGSANFRFFINSNPISAVGEPRPAFNDNAEFAFLVGLSPVIVGQPGEGIFRASESEVVEIARKDDAYEDGTLQNFSHPALNNQGVVAFVADLALETVMGGEGEYTISDKILIVSNGQQYTTVVREGDIIAGKEVKFFSFNDDTSGRTNGFNDASIIAYSVTYTDNSTGINIWNPGLDWQYSSPEGDWDDSSNWFMGMQPDELSDVLINPGIDLDVQGPSEESAIKSLTIGGETGVVRLFLNDGYISASDGISVETAGWFIGSGTLEGALSVQGTIEVVANSNLTLGNVENNGILSVGNGSRLILAGNYSGAGIIEGANGITEFNGDISPGNSPALLDIEGDAVIGGNSIITLELSGENRADEFDAIDIGGVLTLDGVLEITLADGHVLTPGQSYLLIQASEIKGNFDSIQFPDVEGMALDIKTSKTALTLDVSAEDASSDKSGSGNVSWLFMLGFFIVLTLIRPRSNTATFSVSN
ncbi:MAG: hypothetical protein COA54_00265 [Thiotrichaceae bacterium]|nr:MAG: hypothetical protein COA54_00265 [Thiotrichaceae bacterium]